MSDELPNKEKLKEWHQNSSNWIRGIFHFNKEDKLIFPFKRFAITGWTINFANPESLLAYTLIFLVITGLPIGFSFFSK